MLELERSFEKERETIEEMKIFRLLSRSFSENIETSQLQRCRSFYQAQRECLLRATEDLSGDNMEIVTFGLMNSIRVVTFELITRIKLDKQRALR